MFSIFVHNGKIKLEVGAALLACCCLLFLNCRTLLVVSGCFFLLMLASGCLSRLKKNGYPSLQLGSGFDDIGRGLVLELVKVSVEQLGKLTNSLLVI